MHIHFIQSNVNNRARGCRQIVGLEAIWTNKFRSNEEEGEIKCMGRLMNTHVDEYLGEPPVKLIGLALE